MKHATLFPFRPSLEWNSFAPFVECPDFLSQNECLSLRSLMTEGFRAQIEGDGTPREDLKIRGTTIFGLEPSKENEWIFQRLMDAVIQANFDLWGFDLFGFCEGIHLLKYGVKDHYDWHMDIGSHLLSQRKLSAVLQLSDESEYEGGTLEFFKRGEASKKQGTLILFPSFMVHRVQAITKGTRYSFAAWISGNPYK